MCPSAGQRLDWSGRSFSLLRLTLNYFTLSPVLEEDIRVEDQLDQRIAVLLRDADRQIRVLAASSLAALVRRGMFLFRAVILLNYLTPNTIQDIERQQTGSQQLARIWSKCCKRKT